MSKIFKDNEPVLIKTYLFESGLWYLAKTLADTLISQGHPVYFVPKSKYQLASGKFKLFYPSPKNNKEFSKYNLINFNSESSLGGQICQAIERNQIKYLISFETFMEKSEWIPLLRAKMHNKLSIIDVPMVEWVSPRLLEGNAYKIFSEIWTLNNLGKKIFKDYSNTRMINWNFADSKLFNLEGRIKNKNKVTFLHLASTNPDYSSKNTEMVIKTFSKFIEKERPSIECQLLVQGSVTKEYLGMVNKYGNIKINQDIVEREDLAKLYKQSDCLIAPSSREGLSLALYEGLAAGCKVITTDAEPMNYIKTPYLCEVSGVRQGKSLIPIYKVDEDSLLENIKLAYKDIKNEQN